MLPAAPELLLPAAMPELLLPVAEPLPEVALSLLPMVVLAVVSDEVPDGAVGVLAAALSLPPLVVVDPLAEACIDEHSARICACLSLSSACQPARSSSEDFSMLSSVKNASRVVSSSEENPVGVSLAAPEVADWARARPLDAIRMNVAVNRLRFIVISFLVVWTCGKIAAALPTCGCCQCSTFAKFSAGTPRRQCGSTVQPTTVSQVVVKLL